MASPKSGDKKKVAKRQRSEEKETPKQAKKAKRAASVDSNSSNTSNSPGDATTPDFLQAYLMKKEGATLSLACLRKTLHTLTGKVGSKNDGTLTRCIAKIFADGSKNTLPKLTHADLKLSTPPAVYKMETKHLGKHDTRLVGLTLRPRMIPQWKDPSSSKHDLYNRVMENTVEKYRGSDVVQIYASHSPGNTEQQTPRKPFHDFPQVYRPDGTPPPGTDIRIVEGVFVDVKAEVNCLNVSLTCTRVVPQGAGIPSGTYKARYFLDSPQKEGTICTVQQLGMGMWKVTTQLELPRATSQGTTETLPNLKALFQEHLGMALEKKEEVPDDNNEASRDSFGLIGDQVVDL